MFVRQRAAQQASFFKRAVAGPAYPLQHHQQAFLSSLATAHTRQYSRSSKAVIAACAATLAVSTVGKSSSL